MGSGCGTQRVAPTGASAAGGAASTADPDGGFWTGDIARFYDCLGDIGVGQFSRVVRARHRASGGEVAVKCVDLSRTRPSYVENEVLVLRLAAGRADCVQLLDVFEQATKHGSGGRWIYLVLELFAGGELFDRVLAKGPYAEGAAQAPLLHLARAVAFLHEHHIIHRDIKPENILLEDDTEDARAVVADFGLSKVLDATESDMASRPLRGACGTWAYSAPEVHAPDRPGYGVSADMWSLGIIMFVALGGYHPFDPTGEGEEAKVREDMAAGNICWDDPAWTKVSRAAKDLIKQLMHTDPAQRPSAATVLRHPWMRAAVHGAKARLGSRAGSLTSAEATTGGVHAAGAQADGTPSSAAVVQHKRRLRRRLRASFIAAFAATSMASPSTTPKSAASGGDSREGLFSFGTSASPSANTTGSPWLQARRRAARESPRSVASARSKASDSPASNSIANGDAAAQPPRHRSPVKRAKEADSHATDRDSDRSRGSRRRRGHRRRRKREFTVSGPESEGGASSTSGALLPARKRKEVGSIVGADIGGVTDLRRGASFYPAPRSGGKAARKAKQQRRNERKEERKERRRHRKAARRVRHEAIGATSEASEADGDGSVARSARSGRRSRGDYWSSDDSEWSDDSGRWSSGSDMDSLGTLSTYDSYMTGSSRVSRGGASFSRGGARSRTSSRPSSFGSSRSARSGGGQSAYSERRPGRTRSVRQGDAAYDRPMNELVGAYEGRERERTRRRRRGESIGSLESSPRSHVSGKLSAQAGAVHPSGKVIAARPIAKKHSVRARERRASLTRYRSGGREAGSQKPSFNAQLSIVADTSDADASSKKASSTRGAAPVARRIVPGFGADVLSDAEADVPS